MNSHPPGRRRPPPTGVPGRSQGGARREFYSPLFYRDPIGDPTGLSLPPMFMEELFWGVVPGSGWPS